MTLTQLAQAGAKISKQVKLLGVMGQAYVKTGRNGGRYIVFKGLAASRPDLSGMRYLRDNPKVSCFVVGTEEIIEDTAKSTKIAVIAFVAIDIMKECLADRFSMASLGVNVVSDVVQASVGAGVGIFAGAIFVAAGAPVIVTFIVVVVAGAAVGAGLSWIDTHYHLTESARAYVMKLENTSGSWLNEAEAAFSRAGHKVEQIAISTGRAVGRVWSSPEAMSGYEPMLIMP